LPGPRHGTYCAAEPFPDHIVTIDTKTMQTKTNRSQSRATRLHREAMNCVTFAVRERDAGHAADLIDEAIRLKRRSSELAPSDTPAGD